MLRPPTASAQGVALVLSLVVTGATAPAADPAPPAAPAPPRLSLPQEFPRIGGRVVLDTTAAAPAGKPNRGLESAARLVNLYAKEGLAASRPQIAVILHFNATPAALVDAAHDRAGGGSNPNRELVEKLLANGVEVWVCGQSVIRGGHALSDILPGIKVAHSAMVFNLNRQQDGWATLGVY
jgi:uncharacterized protein